MWKQSNISLLFTQITSILLWIFQFICHLLFMFFVVVASLFRFAASFIHYNLFIKTAHNYCEWRLIHPIGAQRSVWIGSIRCCAMQIFSILNWQTCCLSLNDELNHNESMELLMLIINWSFQLFCLVVHIVLYWFSWKFVGGAINSTGKSLKILILMVRVYRLLLN